MRVDDRPTPTISGHRGYEPWPVKLYVGIERQPVENYVYDDHTAFYDDPIDRYVYDASPPYDRYDLWCRFHGLTISTGTPDPEGRFDAGHVEMTLDNRDGGLSQYDAEGRLVDWMPGSHLDIWAAIEAPTGGIYEDWWLFSGRITAWRERQDGTIDAEAFDAFSDLQQEVPEWNPGTYNDTVSQRLTKICTAHHYLGPKRFDTGNIRLHSFLTTATALEEMQNVALSDGGAFACDADGTLTYRDRTWLTGRDDQGEIPILSDNYCETPFHAWDAEQTTDDEVIVNVATLTNLAEQKVTATNAASVSRYGRHTVTRTGEQWISTADGQALANFLVIRRGDHYLRLERFVLHLHDPQQDLWRTGIDCRLGDIITWMHEQPSIEGGVNLIILNVVVQQIVHEITPEMWTTTIGTTRVINSMIPERYDRTESTYDDDPAAIYVY